MFWVVASKDFVNGHSAKDQCEEHLVTGGYGNDRECAKEETVYSVTSPKA